MVMHGDIIEASFNLRLEKLGVGGFGKLAEIDRT